MDDAKRARRLAARRQKITTENFWPQDARSFAKKFAADHPELWELLLAEHDGDRAQLESETELLLKDHVASEIAQAIIDYAPLFMAKRDYRQQRLNEELAALNRDDPENSPLAWELTVDDWEGHDPFFFDDDFERWVAEE